MDIGALANAVPGPKVNWPCDLLTQVPVEIDISADVAESALS